MSASNIPQKQEVVAAYDALAQMVLDENWPLLNALRKRTTVDENTSLAKMLVDIHEWHSQTLQLLDQLIAKELDDTNTAGTLFRNNTLASKSMSYWARLPEGASYLKRVIGPFVAKVATNQYGSLEINPENAQPDDDIASNIAQLSTLAQEALDTICSTVNECPLQMRMLCANLRAQCLAKFPESGSQAVGGFIILRFFGPAIVTPEKYGLAEGVLGLDARRILVFISKTIQNLANGVWFRESFMDALNKFLSNNQEKMTTFLEEVSTVPPFAANAAPSQPQVSAEDYYTSIRDFAVVCRKHMVDIDKFLHLEGDASKDEYLYNLRLVLGKIVDMNASMKRPAVTADGESLASDRSADGESRSILRAVLSPLTNQSDHIDEKKRREREQKELEKKEKKLKKMEKDAAKGKNKEDLVRARHELHAQAMAMAGEAMCEAADKWQLPVIEEWLVKDKAFVNARDSDGSTVLHHACSAGCLSIVRVLLKAKADCYLDDKRGWTALHCAACDNQLDVVLELCKQKHIDFNSVNDDGNTPLHYLVRNPYDPRMEDIVGRFLAGGADINAQNVSMETPLHMAVLKRNPGMVTLLLKNGADPLIQNVKQESPWDWASRQENQSFLSLFETVIKAKAASQPGQKRGGNSASFGNSTTRAKALWAAIRTDSLDTVRELLRADPKLADATFGTNKNTALHIAVAHENKAMVKLLLEHVTKIDKNTLGWTPLMSALWQGNEELALLILMSKLPVDVKQRFCDGNTALHFAARMTSQYSTLLIFGLIQRDADVDAVNSMQDTPLHIAVQCGNVNAVRTLTEGGATINKMNKLRETPLDLAMKCSQSSIISILEAHCKPSIFSGMD